MTIQEIKLNQKIKEAKERTKQWALGIECVEFPCESCLTRQEAKKMTMIDKSEITNLGRGGKRVQGMKFIDGVWIK